MFSLQKKEHVIFVALLVVLVLVVALVNFGVFEGNVAGKAGEQLTAPLGYYWTKAPVKTTLEKSGACVDSNSNFITSKYSVEGVISGSEYGCCVQKNDCVAALNLEGYCFSPGSVAEINDNPVKGSAICVDNPGWPSNWIFCGSKNEVIKGNLYCDGTSWKTCTKEGLFGDAYCDGSKWTECDSTKNPDEIVAGGKYTCNNNNKWEECNNVNSWKIEGNNICLDGKKWTEFDDTYDPFDCTKNTCNNFDVTTTAEYTSITTGNHFSKAGNFIDNSVDLKNNKAFYNILTTTSNIFFKYNQETFLIGLDESSKIVVSPASDLNKPITAVTLTPATKGVHLNSVQLDLELDAKQAGDEVYINVIVGSSYGKEVLIVVTPRVDLYNSKSSKIILSSENIQDLTLEDKSVHTVNLFAQDPNYLMLLDGKKQFTATKGSKAKYFFDALEQQQLSYESDESFGEFAIITLDTISDHPTIANVPQKAVNLTTDYEAAFSQDLTINLGEPLNLVGVCDSDLNEVTNVLTVCGTKAEAGKTEKFNGLSDGLYYVQNNVLFLYNSEAGKNKTGKAYHIIDLDNAQNGIKKEAITVFAKNLFAERSVVVKSNEIYYLLNHDKNAVFDLEKLKLTRLAKTKDEVDAEAVYIPEGDADEVIFNLPLSKQVSIKFNGGPDSGYTLQKTTVEKKEVDLYTNLQTRVSTYGAVDITKPAGIGKFSVHPDDIKSVSNKVKILAPNGLVELNKGGVKEQGQVLLHYTDFTSGGKDQGNFIFTKYIDIYLYHSFTSGTFIHKFTDNEFTIPLAKGNKLAFNLDDKYYLLGYADKWTGSLAGGFDIEKMQLTDLDGKNPITAKLTKEGYEFNFGENRVEFVIKKDGVESFDNIVFTGVTKEGVAGEKIKAESENLLFDSKKNFSMVLTPGTELKPVTLEFEKAEYKICDQKDIALLESQVRLCVTANGAQTVEETLALNDEKLIGTGKNVLIKYVGKKDGKKTITFQHVFGLPINNMPWTATLETFATKNYPLVKLGNTNYELVGGSTLDSFTLGGSGIAMNSTKEAFEAGVIVVGENQVVFQKALDGNSIKFDVTLLKEKLLSSTAFNFTANLNLPIVTEVGGEVYTLSPTQSGGDTIDFKVLKGTDVLYQGKLAKNVPKKILLTNGKIITVTYLETVKGVAKLAVSQ